MKVKPSNVLVKIRVQTDCSKNCYFETVSPDKSKEKYHLNSESETLIPYRKKLTFINDN